MMEKRYDPRIAEPRWQKFWDEQGIYRFGGGIERPVFAIDTPPPTVSGSIHIGHVSSYSQAEMVARYRRMKGYDVFYPFGFDDNGLPTERLVEREFHIESRNLDREELSALCLQTTIRFEEEFKKLWQSLGFSVDWNLAYSTISQPVQRISQLSFVDLYRKGLAYRGFSPVLWCPECRTSLAQADLETRESKTFFQQIRFGLEDGGHVTIATTRPELLPACVALFIHPDDPRASQLVGQSAMVPLFGQAVPILADDRADPDKGTGVVMCCTFGDQADVYWQRTYRLPIRMVLDESGRLEKGIPHIGGMATAQARETIVQVLREAGAISGSQPLAHSIAVHERCGSPIEFGVSAQWFIRVLDRKEEFLAAADRIHWYPESMKARFISWVNNLQWDWCISRQRFFGVPFPVWYCQACGEALVGDPASLPVNPLRDVPWHPCPSCGGSNFEPEADVMDTWATSSLTPLINAGWDGDTMTRKGLLPMGMRTQAHEIIRTWAFYSIVKSLYHTGDIPWRDIMICGFVLAGKGQKISKSKGNARETPQELIQTHSADAMRYWAAGARLGTDTFFAQDDVEAGKRFMVKLWNAARLCESHLAAMVPMDRPALHPFDRWILRRMHQAHEQFGRYMDQYEVGLARPVMERAFWHDFCDYYLEVVKERLYASPEDASTLGGHISAQWSLSRTLLTVLKMAAVFAPHITEEIYQNLYRPIEGTISMHLLPWETDLAQVGEDLDDRAGAAGVEIIAGVRRWKTGRALSLAAPIGTVDVTAQPELIPWLDAARDDLIAVLKARDIRLNPARPGSAIELTIPEK